MGKLYLKSCVLPLSVGFILPPLAQGRGCQSGEAPPQPVCVCPETGAQHTSAAAGGESILFRDTGTNRNEFPDCSILFPGP